MNGHRMDLVLGPAVLAARCSLHGHSILLCTENVMDQDRQPAASSDCPSGKTNPPPDPPKTNQNRGRPVLVAQNSGVYGGRGDGLEDWLIFLRIGAKKKKTIDMGIIPLVAISHFNFGLLRKGITCAPSFVHRSKAANPLQVPIFPRQRIAPSPSVALSPQSSCFALSLALCAASSARLVTVFTPSLTASVPR